MKRKTILTGICACLLLPFLQAQTGPVITRVSMPIPKFIVELAPASDFTFTTGLMIRPGFAREDSEGETYYSPVPKLNLRIYLEPRYFFNYESRLRRGKRVDYHSGWYAGVPFSLRLSDRQFTLSPVVGFQCTFGARWYWNFETGPGVFYTDGHFKILPYVDAGFGIVISP